MATNRHIAAKPRAQAGSIHQCLRSTLLTSAVVNSPLRTMLVTPKLQSDSVTGAKLHANSHDLALRHIGKVIKGIYFNRLR